MPVTSPESRTNRHLQRRGNRLVEIITRSSSVSILWAGKAQEGENGTPDHDNDNRTALSDPSAGKPRQVTRGNDSWPEMQPPEQWLHEGIDLYRLSAQMEPPP